MEAWARRNPRAFDSPGTPEQLAELRRRSDEEDRLNDEFIRQECIREGRPIPPGLQNVRPVETERPENKPGAENGFECINCGRIMSKREAAEQGACDACRPDFE